ncbi:type VI secretion system Vgr family protein [Paraburkholderia bonniea]|uniref:type VI secretion system Vgr family protein n=1 Tax=Paraburkholderia bonniea TaxID=2152891 RepID=UPI001292206B|nr:type VI secretion system tip protein TssI/VgrG [Paraburkholderia bonniea]
MTAALNFPALGLAASGMSSAETAFEYSFECAGHVAGTFLVSQWQGQERVSEPYRFEILLASKLATLEPQSLLGSRATLTINDANGTVARRHGVLTSVAQLDCDDHFTYYRVVLEPRLARLREWIYSEIYLNLALPDVIRQVLRQGALTAEPGGSGDYDLRLAAGAEDSAPTQNNFICQFEESCLAFLTRRLAHEGWYYYFEQLEHSEAVVFCASQAQQPTQPLDLYYRSGGSLRPDEGAAVVERFSEAARDTAQQVTLKDFAATRAMLELSVAQRVSGGNVGEWTRYGEHFDSERAGTRLAALRAEALACEATRFSGATRSAALSAGFTLTLHDHFRERCNMRYYVTEVTHWGAQPLPLVAAQQDHLSRSYRNEFTALPDSMQYRPALTTPWPRIAGYISAVIDAEGDGKLAELDENGCYKVQFLFDRADKQAGRGSAWVRLATPYGGANHGMHFPLHKGTEVLVTFINGDPDRPVIAATVPNSEHPNLVTQKNPTQNALQTAGGNSLLMDDRDGAQSMTMASPVAGTNIVLGAAATPGMALSSQGHMAMVSSSATRSVPGAYSETITGGHKLGSLAGSSRVATIQRVKSDLSTTGKDAISSSDSEGYDGAAEESQGIGSMIQDYLGSVAQNYFGSQVQSIAGFSSALYALVNVQAYTGWQFLRLANGYQEFNEGPTNISASSRCVMVSGLTTLMTNELRMGATAEVDFTFGDWQVFAASVNVESQAETSIASVGEMALSSPLSIALTVDSSGILMTPETARVTSTGLTYLGGTGATALFGQMVNIGGAEGPAEIVTMTADEVTITSDSAIVMDGEVIMLG